MKTLPEMVYNGPDMASRTSGYRYRIRSVTNVGVKTIYEFYDNHSRLKQSEYFISEAKFLKMYTFISKLEFKFRSIKNLR